MNNAAATAPLPPASRRNSSVESLLEVVQLVGSAADSYVRRRLLLALLLVAAGALLSALTPLALKVVVDDLSAPGRHEGMKPLILVLLYVAGQYLSRCSTDVRMMIHGHADQRLRRRIGVRLFEHIIRMPMRFHLERKAGAMGETAEQGLRGLHQVLEHIVYTIVPVTVELAAIAFVLLQTGHPFYLLTIGFATVAYAFAFHRWARTIGDVAKHVSAKHIDSHALLTDALVNAETIKYFDAETSMSRRYEVALGQTESAWRRFFRTYAINGIVVNTVFATSLGVSLFLAMREVLSGTMSVGDFILINAYVVRLVQPLEQLGFAIRDVAQGLAFLGNMLGLLRQKTEADVEPLTDCKRAMRGELHFANVTFRYRQEREVVTNVSFIVPPGRTLAIVGVSGSGKSSLIRLLFRLYEPDSGSILLDGVPIQQMRLSDVRRAIAVVPQDTVLFHDTIAANIGFGRLGASRHEIEEAAHVATLHDFIMGLPEQYETVVGERGLKLSGGERQRVAIARAVLKQPRIVVFDEATSSLDTRTEKEILRNLAVLASHCTTLVIAHRLSTIVHADQILVLHAGVVVECGTHDQLLAQAGQYAALWYAQQSGGMRRDAKGAGSAA